MKKTAFASLLAAAMAIAHAQALRPSSGQALRQGSGAVPLTPEQTLDRRGIGGLEFSPDGSRLAFTVTEPVKGTARAQALWLLDVAS